MYKLKIYIYCTTFPLQLQFYEAFILLRTVVIYGFNIWNAWSYPHEEDGRSLAVWDMVIKLSHIPF